MRLYVLACCLMCGISMYGQMPFDQGGMGGLGGLGSSLGNTSGTRSAGKSGGTWGRDTSKVEKSVPTEFYQWRIDERLGTMMREEYNDTLPHGFQNYNGTDGMAGGYMILGNLGSPRYAVNFLDRPEVDNLMFIQPYDYFHTRPGNLLFTNTKSPLTNLQYHKSGTRQNGQDRFRAYFATNVNKLTALGFKIDYLYGRGYYNNQANSQFGGTVFGYHLGERYEMHAMGSWEHMKMSENGGITDDNYINDPQSFIRRVGSRDIPTVFSSLYNRNDHQTYYLTHRYNLGKYHEIEVPDSLKPQVPNDEELLKRWMPITLEAPAKADEHNKDKDDIDTDSAEAARERYLATRDSLRAIRDSQLVVLKNDSVRYGLTLDSLRQVWISEQIPPREFVPVTSFIHTLHVRRLTHALYNRSNMPTGYLDHDPYYRSRYDSFKDETRGMSIKNTLGVALREGFNKWAKAGITLFAAHEYRNYALPDSIGTTDTTSVWQHYVENHVSVGGEIRKALGHTLHYHAGAELWVIGPDAGDVAVNGSADLNFRLGKDTVRLEARGYFTATKAPFYFDHFHSSTTWWDNSFDKETRTKIEGVLSLDRTWTRLRFGVENISGYRYLRMNLTPLQEESGSSLPYARGVSVGQQSGSIQVLSASINQDLHLGWFHWENSVTWQQSSAQDVLPLPMLYIYTNPYLKFVLAKVLTVEVGADMRFWTKYYAPDYEPLVNQFAIQDAAQERVKIGGFPIMHAYANFAIKRVRGYIKYERFAGGSKNAFWAPHYPIDPSGIHFGISWNFYD